MKSTFLYLFTFLPFFLNAQEIDTIWYNNKWEKTDDTKAKHYFRTINKVSDKSFFVCDFFETKAKQMEGYYSSLNPEIKNGTFLYWFRNGRIQLETTYKNNEQMQVRQYDETGNIVQEWELLEIASIVNGKLIKELVSIERSPKFPGGEEDMNKYLFKSLKEINTNNISGQTNVQFKVNTDGTISDITLLNKLNPRLDKEIIKTIQKMPNWIPGKQKGKLVAVKMFLPINFE